MIAGIVTGALCVIVLLCMWAKIVHENTPWAVHITQASGVVIATVSRHNDRCEYVKHSHGMWLDVRTGDVLCRELANRAENLITSEALLAKVRA